MKNLKLKHLGIGLLELLLSLAIISIILLIATRYYGASLEAKKVADADDQLGIIQNAGNRWLLTHADYSSGADLITSTTSFKDFVNRDYLPSSYYNNTTKSSSLKNPWGGDITVLFTSSAMTVTLKTVSETSSAKLQSQYKSILCQSGGINPILSCVQNTDDKGEKTAVIFCDVAFKFFSSCSSSN